MSSLVSVVIPVFNREKMIAEALETALTQTYVNLQIVVVDDGSTDQTTAIIQDFANRDPRVLYLSQKHEGAAAARNHGTKHAHGEFVAFLDSDDLWSPGKLSRQMSIFETDPRIGMVYCSGYVSDHAGKRDDRLTKLLKPAELYTLEKMLFEHPVFFTSSVVVRKKHLFEAGLFDHTLSFYEDLDLWFRVLLNTEAYFLNEELMILRKHTENLAARRSDLEMNTLHVKVRQKMVSLFEHRVRPLTFAEKEQALYRYQLDLIKEALADSSAFEARREIVSYLKSHPGYLPAYFYYLLSLIPGSYVSQMIRKRRKWKQADGLL